MESYKFKVQFREGNRDQQKEYEFVVDEAGNPKKIGDGTFGAVFEAKLPDPKRCAVKLFYPTSEGSVSHTRNYHEMIAGYDVRNQLNERELDALKANLVLSDGWTTEFKKSEAYKSLKKAFQNLGIAVSQYALVMPYYECSLKDLLENGAPAKRFVSGEVMNKAGEPGYTILKNMSLSERERNIAGIISQVVTGLWGLHAVNLCHRDVKPANVMMRAVGNHVQVSLGDFGFLDAVPETNGTGYDGILPLGTRHYRSPEQKDYFDLCDVSVSINNNDAKPQLILETTDKKFNDTLIETGDIAQFAKDKHRSHGAERKAGYHVELVKHTSEKSKIVLTDDKKMAFADKKTQVSFYKNPTRRTDLFGVGALIFDMLTLGKSPERFYDYLRPFDHANSNGNGISVNTVIEKYRAMVHTNTTTADLAQIFKQVRDDTSGIYPSHEIMTIILRCMMSRTSGSYVREANDEYESKFFTRILEDIANLPSLRQNADSSSIATDATPLFSTKSPLWKGEYAKETSTDTNEFFESGLIKLYECTSSKKRFVLGARHLNFICKTIGDICEKQEFYFDIGPNNLPFKENYRGMGQILTTYQNEDQYLNALLTGVALNRGDEEAAGNMIPLFLRLNSRKMYLNLEEKSEDGKEIRAKAWYADSPPLWRRCVEGNYLRILDKSGRAGLFEIVHVESSGAFLQIRATQVKSNEGFSIGVNEEKLSGWAIRQLHPAKCYISMLATYLHHLFFVDYQTDTGNISDEAWDYLKSIDRGQSSDPSIRQKQKKISDYFPRNPFKKTDKTDVDKLRHRVAELYMYLIWLSEIKNISELAELIVGMNREVNKVLEEIAQFAGFKSKENLLFSSDDKLEDEQQTDIEDQPNKGLSHYLQNAINGKN